MHLWSWVNVLSFNRALNAFLSLVSPPKNNICGCMAAFFGRKTQKQKIRNWRNIKTKFLARISANLKHKTSHVRFNIEIIFIKGD